MSISKIVEGLLTGDLQEPMVKSITIRLDVDDFASLAVLARRLGQAPSSLLRLLSTDAIETAVSAYMSVQSKDSNELADFSQDVSEYVIDLLSSGEVKAKS